MQVTRLIVSLCDYNQIGTSIHKAYSYHLTCSKEYVLLKERFHGLRIV